MARLCNEASGTVEYVSWEGRLQPPFALVEQEDPSYDLAVDNVL